MGFDAHRDSWKIIKLRMDLMSFLHLLMLRRKLCMPSWRVELRVDTITLGGGFCFRIVEWN